MSIRYKKDILAELKKQGFSAYALRHEKMLSESVIQKLRTKSAISFDNLDKICEMLECQPGDLLEYVPEEIDVDALYEAYLKKQEKQP